MINIETVEPIGQSRKSKEPHCEICLAQEREWKASGTNASYPKCRSKPEHKCDICLRDCCGWHSSPQFKIRIGKEKGLMKFQICDGCAKGIRNNATDIAMLLKDEGFDKMLIKVFRKAVMMEKFEAI